MYVCCVGWMWQCCSVWISKSAFIKKVVGATLLAVLKHPSIACVCVCVCVYVCVCVCVCVCAKLGIAGVCHLW